MIYRVAGETSPPSALFPVAAACLALLCGHAAAQAPETSLTLPAVTITAEARRENSAGADVINPITIRCKS
ncbi:hypothetical protein ACDW_43510 (plasmid) [Acidovorax sp. DW039]|uniref:hypothetical protein n=1 Tax=Acidovorax sp. DW039 TaxID=3095606 RepID=UPI003085E142|nr:hypothetical protein ACDW_43510 [Acidovorax sp. DW039]